MKNKILSEEIQNVINEIGKLQALSNEKGYNLDFEAPMILLEGTKTLAETLEVI